MASAERSLRRMVERWLAPDPTMPIRVTRFRNSHSQSVPDRHVRVTVGTSTGQIEIFFFRHEDGAWREFPSGPKYPAMRKLQICTELEWLWCK